MLRTSNPVLSNEIFTVPSATRDDRMTVQGTVTKTIFVILVAMAAAGFVWREFFLQHDVSAYIIGGLIGGSVLALINIFRRSSGFITTPLYAACEGLFL